MIMKNNLKKVVITGGAGFIGSNLIRKLIEKDIEKILVIDDLSTGNIDNISEFKDNNFIEFVESRVEDCQNLNSLIEGYDFCFHLAAGVGVQYIMENVSKALLTNIEGTHKIIESCKINGIPLLLTSTSEVYGVSDDPIWTEESKSLIGPPTKLRWSYAASKLIDEFLALSEFNDGKLNPIIVRLFNIIGNNQLSKFGMVVPKFIEAALENKPLIIHGDGTQTRSFTWVGDVVNYFYLLAEKQLYGEIFNIGQTEEISIKNLAEMIIKETDSKSEIIFKTHKEVYGERFEDPMRRTPSIKKIVDATDYSPTMTIPEMIKEIIDYKKLNS
jgi:UDP-glucose 4-epimerase